MPRRSTELLQEFIVIVIGVFVALAAESWWSERQDRRIQREIREDMVAEFEANIRILEADLVANERARPRMAILEGLSDEALMALTENPRVDGSIPSLATISNWVIRNECRVSPADYPWPPAPDFRHPLALDLVRLVLVVAPLAGLLTHVGKTGTNR